MPPSRRSPQLRSRTGPSCSTRAARSIRLPLSRRCAPPAIRPAHFIPLCRSSIRPGRPCSSPARGSAWMATGAPFGCRTAWQISSTHTFSGSRPAIAPSITWRPSSRQTSRSCWPASGRGSWLRRGSPPRSRAASPCDSCAPRPITSRRARPRASSPAPPHVPTRRRSSGSWLVSPPIRWRPMRTGPCRAPPPAARGGRARRPRSGAGPGGACRARRRLGGLGPLSADQPVWRDSDC
jgi:hypothetical protein